jgi:8-oxo-dGTP pyrophosphatase MutT (NUDIX family)
MTAVQPIRPAATVILVRDAAQDYEIFMLRRTSDAAFAGGMFVFPGGRVDGDDHLHSYDRWRQGPAERQRSQQRALGDEWRGFWIAAIRESFEEAGLLLAYDASGEFLSFPDSAVAERFERYRGPLHAGAISLADICAAENLRLAVDRVHFYNRFITPLGRPRRFDTRFFVAEAPPGQIGRHDSGETVDSIWITPADALARNDAREFDLMRVTRVQLEELARFRSKADLLAAAAARAAFPIFRPQVPVDLPNGR